MTTDHTATGDGDRTEVDKMWYWDIALLVSKQERSAVSSRRWVVGGDWWGFGKTQDTSRLPEVGGWRSAVGGR